MRAFIMRPSAIFALMLVAMLLVPVQAGKVTIQQQQQEDPRQPNANNSTMYLYHDGFAEPWSHFADNDPDSAEEGEYREEKDNGVIDIKLRFIMKPQLIPRFKLVEGGEVRGNIRIDVGGDWENGGNGNCNNDCENLNISIFKGPAEIWTNSFSGVQSGEQSVPFLFTVTEDMLEWDGRDDNPIIEVRMKLKGDRTSPFPGIVQGTPAHFAIKLGTQSKVEFPIDPDSWTEEFQAGDDTMKEEEDTPGFSLVVASSAMGMAVFVNQRRQRDEDNEEA